MIPSKTSYISGVKMHTPVVKMHTLVILRILEDTIVRGANINQLRSELHLESVEIDRTDKEVSTNPSEPIELRRYYQKRILESTPKDSVKPFLGFD